MHIVFDRTFSICRAFCKYSKILSDITTAMPSTLTIYDETTSGQKSTAVRLEFLKEKITVQELIRERIYQEVQDYNLKQPEYFRGLVQPTEAEKTLNGFKMRKARKIDWEEQYNKALKGFEANGF